jgi:hypothetical protein
MPSASRSRPLLLKVLLKVLSPWLLTVPLFAVPSRVECRVDQKSGMTFWIRGRSVGRQAQIIPQLSSTTDQYAAGALSQNGSCVLIPLCSVERRTREMAHVLSIISFCLIA